jgi:hypothetical protein
MLVLSAIWLFFKAVWFSIKVAWYLIKVYRTGNWVQSFAVENPDAVHVGKKAIKSIKVEYNDGSVETY